jgi:hypothetical protein
LFEIKVEGVDELLKNLETFGRRIEKLQESVPQEMMEWQRDDMRRTFPNLKTESSGNDIAASTEIWPRSRLPSKDQHRQHQGPKVHSLVPVAPKQHRGPMARSTRPILRAELVQKLHDRMIRLTTEAMKWP